MDWDDENNRNVGVKYVGGRLADRTPQGVSISGHYKGKAEVGGEFNAGYKSDVSLTIQNNRVDGEFRNFRKKVCRDCQNKYADVNGSVRIDGRINGNSLDANLTGSFDSHTIQSGQMNGAFFGPNGEEVGGGIAGKTLKGETFGGAWGAKKQ